MTAPSPEDVRRALAGLDGRHQKIVAGMLAMMIKDPERVREREWISAQLTEIVLLAGGFEAESARETVAEVRDFLRDNVDELLRASFLLFQRVALDLAPRTDTGFTFDEALQCGLAYLPSLGTGPAGAEGVIAAEPDVAPATPRERARDLGEQPLTRLMAERGLKPRDLVAASTEQLTHKMVSRAMRGRRLTANTMGKIRRAWREAAADPDGEDRLFDYEP